MSHSGHRLTSAVFLATRELARQPPRAMLSVVVASFVVGLVIVTVTLQALLLTALAGC